MSDSRDSEAYCLSILSQWLFHCSKASSLSVSRLSHALADFGSTAGLYSSSSKRRSSSIGLSLSAIALRLHASAVRLDDLVDGRVDVDEAADHLDQHRAVYVGV